MVACKIALQRRPDCPISLSNKAGILSAIGEAQEALVTVEWALAIDRTYEDAWLTKAMIMAANYCDFPRTMLAFDTARRFGKTGVEGRIVEAWARAADTLSRKRRNWMAVRCLDCARLYCPQAPSLLTKKGVILCRDFHLRSLGVRILLRAKELGDRSADSWIESFGVRVK